MVRRAPGWVVAAAWLSLASACSGGEGEATPCPSTLAEIDEPCRGSVTECEYNPRSCGSAPEGWCSCVDGTWQCTWNACAPMDAGSDGGGPDGATDGAADAGDAGPTPCPTTMAEIDEPCHGETVNCEYNPGWCGAYPEAWCTCVEGGWRCSWNGCIDRDAGPDGAG